LFIGVLAPAGKQISDKGLVSVMTKVDDFV